MAHTSSTAQLRPAAIDEPVHKVRLASLSPNALQLYPCTTAPWSVRQVQTKALELLVRPRDPLRNRLGLRFGLGLLLLVVLRVARAEPLEQGYGLAGSWKTMDSLPKDYLEYDPCFLFDGEHEYTLVMIMVCGAHHTSTRTVNTFCSRIDNSHKLQMQSTTATEKTVPEMSHNWTTNCLWQYGHTVKGRTLCSRMLTQIRILHRLHWCMISVLDAVL